MDCMGEDKCAPVFRIGVVSDTQSEHGPGSNAGRRNLQRALEQLKAMGGVDIVLYGGDVTNNADPRVYDDFHETVSRVFPEAAPQFLFVMGNHDYGGGLAVDVAQANFTSGLRIPSINNHFVMNGFDFIGLSPEDGNCHGTYGEASRVFLEEALRSAEERAPGQPIFVLTHQHGKGTVYGSDEWGNPFISEMLKGHPSVIHFSGHSHYSIRDERSIHQGEYTSVGTSSLLYTELESGKVNGSIPPESTLCEEYLYVEVFQDRIILHRINLYSGTELAPAWCLKLPLEKNTFTYTDERAKHRIAPEFPKNAEISRRFDDEGMHLTFTAAKHPEFVHSYAVTLGDQEYLFFSDFYKNLPEDAPVVNVTVPREKLPEGAESMTVSVYPIESYGRRGGGLSM